MESFFRYNWIVREQWFQWCEDVPLEELLRPRTGGGKPDGMENFDNYKTLEAVRQFERKLRPDVETFVLSWDPSMEKRPYFDPELDSTVAKESWGEVMRHVIAHEIHHMGQLSIWSRELDKKPVSANFIALESIRWVELSEEIRCLLEKPYKVLPLSPGLEADVVKIECADRPYVLKRSVIGMEQKVQTYFELKQQQKEIEQRLSVLRDEIVGYCEEQGVYETQVGGYAVKTVLQHRKEYDDQKLYASLPDPDIWRLLSKVDSHKLKSLIKLNILTEEQISPACTVKPITLLQVDKL
ncbi:hypothetical protein G195_000566 [Phytophthora kernoviae 00238/432]|uniref:Uncharacterized protein n=1 Tax=Phytophthora kernoviae 00238/432 TaxID=1284355 RepID=A0A8J4SLB3_9STRA|nr:hypothetical protein G195_000566 [Phytophthora kernoviae 00238/432]